jgi:hypothetical protein
MYFCNASFLPPLKGEVSPSLVPPQRKGSLEKEYRKGIPFGHCQRQSAD